MTRKQHVERIKQGQLDLGVKPNPQGKRTRPFTPTSSLYMQAQLPCSNRLRITRDKRSALKVPYTRRIFRFVATEDNVLNFGMREYRSMFARDRSVRASTRRQLRGVKLGGIFAVHARAALQTDANWRGLGFSGLTKLHDHT